MVGMRWDGKRKRPFALGVNGRKPLVCKEFRGAPEEIRTPDPQIRSLFLYKTIGAANSALKRIAFPAYVRLGRNEDWDSRLCKIRRLKVALHEALQPPPAWSR
jgi:hypothetical protein